MNSNPLVSIIIPCYNHEKYVQYTINSIINQDYENIELIIIDDGSKDNSIAKIKEMENQCFKRFKRFEIRSRENKGLSKTLNEGIDWCEGKYISLIASDDIMLPYKTTIQVNYLENNPQITSVFSNMEYIDSNGKPYYTSSFLQEEHDFEKIWMKMALFAPTQMHHLSAIKNVAGFDEDFVVEDLSMWLKLVHNGYRLMLLKDVLVQYRRHEHNISNNYDKMINDEREILELYKMHPLYSKLDYLLKLKEIKSYKNNGKKIIYYFLKSKIVMQLWFLKLFA